ncbi:MAG: glycerate kinase type-2 family protein [Candidatus Puniceispirillaceae bacterium]
MGDIADMVGMKALARRAFEAACAAGHPAGVTREAMARLETPPTAVISVGKAAGAMAAAVRDAGCDAPGIIVTSDEALADDDLVLPAGMTVFPSAHPVPDVRGIAAGEAVMDFAGRLGADDHLLLLISGGGSALLPAPAKGMNLADKQALNEALLASGMDIHEMNAVRRLFSRLKGGRLARRAAPARITQFLLSDVPGDRFESIASGPAVVDPVPLETALKLIRDAGLDRLEFMTEQLVRIEAGQADLPLRPGDPLADAVTTHLLASNSICRAAARDVLRSALGGLREVALPDLAGDAAGCARDLAATLAGEVSRGALWAVTGGETTVRLGDNPGAGGRAQEMGVAFALALAEEGDGEAEWTALIGGTDGRDGPTDAAGALVGPMGGGDMASARAALAAHDCYPYLEARDELLMVPPTGTNLGDIGIFVMGRQNGAGDDA